MLIGTKLHMTQLFSEKGEVVPVTVLEAKSCVVTHIKSEEKDGYSAVQIGHGERKRTTKPIAGHLKGNGPFRAMREFRVPKDNTTVSDVQVGDALDVSQFSIGDKLLVVGTSKGKGFQGVVKRHGFAGQKASHGNKDQLRAPGSIGATDAARVFKGKRMAGQTGNARVTVKNIEVVKIDEKEHQLYVKGSVPGSPKSMVLLKNI